MELKRVAGVDVGGTFTDIAFWDDKRKTVILRKVLTTPQDATEGIISGVRALPEWPQAIVHGTTLVINALIQRRGALLGLITTQGYRDILEMRRELRYDAFDLFLKIPEPLVPRSRRLEVKERIGANGGIVSSLDEDGVRSAARQLKKMGVEAVAVAFVNAYRNPIHELRAVVILREELPDTFVCSSAEIAPELREYERFSTVAANAYVMPLVSRYLERLLHAAKAPVFVMLSDGGIATARTAMQIPINLVESGPAAGAMVAAHLAKTAGWDRVIAFDMGGTTAKISLIHDGVPSRSHELEVARVHRFKKGSGLPVRTPVVQLIEIGTGGGSIAWVNKLGLLKIGPESANAMPGPACYGQGGTEATVTDADLYLGLIGADSFLGGDMPLSRSEAEKVLDRLAERLELDRTATAAGIVDIAESNMAMAARMHIAEQGEDPRRYRLIAFGGAGPVHAYGIARTIGLEEVVIPRGAGVASAIGMLVAAPSAEFTCSYVQRLDNIDWEVVHGILSELMARGRQLLIESGAAETELRMESAADMRYVGQGHEVTVMLDQAVFTAKDAAGLRSAFELEYKTRFGRSLDDMQVEVVSWRVRVSSRAIVERLDLEHVGDSTARESERKRAVYFSELGGFHTTPVYSRNRLARGKQINGPAVIEEAESTVIVGPRATVVVDEAGNLIMRLNAQGTLQSGVVGEMLGYAAACN